MSSGTCQTRTTVASTHTSAYSSAQHYKAPRWESSSSDEQMQCSYFGRYRGRHAEEVSSPPILPRPHIVAEDSCCNPGSSTGYIRVLSSKLRCSTALVHCTICQRDPHRLIGIDDIIEVMMMAAIRRRQAGEGDRAEMVDAEVPQRHNATPAPSRQLLGHGDGAIKSCQSK